MVSLIFVAKGESVTLRRWGSNYLHKVNITIDSERVKVTSHLQRPKESFFFLLGKIEVSHFI